MYRIEVTAGPGSGVRILNRPQPPAFRESVRVAEQNLYVRGKDLQAATLLMLISARRALNDLPDELWTKLSIEFYSNITNAVFKSLME